MNGVSREHLHVQQPNFVSLLRPLPFILPDCVSLTGQAVLQHLLLYFFNQALGHHGEKAAVFLKAPSRSKIYSENLLILQALVNGTDTTFFLPGKSQTFLMNFHQSVFEGCCLCHEFQKPILKLSLYHSFPEGSQRGSCLCYFNSGEQRNKNK